MTVGATLNPTVVVTSEVLGPLTVSTDQVVEFAEGIYGFPTATRFALLPTPREGLYWLQSLDHTALVFLLVDPFPAFPHYHIELGEADKARLATASPEDILVLAIVTMPAEGSQRPTANLHAPLMFNVSAGQGHQSIRPDNAFSIREEFELSP
jgi:flagellar assembly factor FliW